MLRVWLTVATKFLVIYDNRKRRPNAQHLPHRFSSCADKLQVEVMWRCKDKVSPSLAYMDQSTPCLQCFNSIESIRVVGVVGVTDCLAYLTFFLLFPSSRSAPIRDSGPLCPLLTNLPMD